MRKLPLSTGGGMNLQGILTLAGVSARVPLLANSPHVRGQSQVGRLVEVNFDGFVYGANA
jgi:hypothetical protein